MINDKISETGKRKRRSGWDVAEKEAVATDEDNDGTIKKIAQSANQGALSQEEANLAILKAKQFLASEALQRSLQTASLSSMAAGVRLPVVQPPILSLPQISISPTPVTLSVPQVERLDCRLYVGSIQYDIQLPDIQSVFACFGPIAKIDLSHDPLTGKHKGFCFVEYTEPQFALAAAAAMDGFELGGRKIKIGRPHAMGTAASLSLTNITNAVKTNISATIPPVSAAPHPPVITSLKRRIKISNVRSEISLDDLKAIFDPFGKIVEADFVCPPIPSISSSAVCVRIAEIAYSLADAAAEAVKSMNNVDVGGFKLVLELIEDSSSQISSVAAKTALSAVSALSSKLGGSRKGSESQSVLKPRKLLLEGMASIEEIGDDSLKEEVKMEAEKYGAIESINIGLNSSGIVTVSLLYCDSESAAIAHKTFNGRYFAGKSIVAILSNEFLSQTSYELLMSQVKIGALEESNLHLVEKLRHQALEYEKMQEAMRNLEENVKTRSNSFESIHMHDNGYAVDNRYSDEHQSPSIALSPTASLDTKTNIGGSSSAKAKGLPRPLSTISLTSSVEELAEINNFSSNSPSMYNLSMTSDQDERDYGERDERDISSSGELEDEQLTRRRHHLQALKYRSYEQQRQPFSPSLDKDEYSSPLLAEFGNLLKQWHLEQLKIERERMQRELFLNLRSNVCISSGTIKNCLKSVEGEISKLDVVIETQSQKEHQIAQENTQLRDRIAQLENQIIQQTEEINNLKVQLETEEEEADDIATQHKDEIEELAKENEELRQQRNYFKDELALTVTNREIAHNIEHQQEMMELKHSYEALLGEKETLELEMQHKLSESHHQIEQATRELASISLKYEHQLNTLKYDHENTKKDLEAKDVHHARRTEEYREKFIALVSSKAATGGSIVTEEEIHAIFGLSKEISSSCGNNGSGESGVSQRRSISGKASFDKSPLIDSMISDSDFEGLLQLFGCSDTQDACLLAIASYASKCSFSMQQLIRVVSSTPFAGIRFSVVDLLGPKLIDPDQNDEQLLALFPSEEDQDRIRVIMGGRLITLSLFQNQGKLPDFVNQNLRAFSDQSSSLFNKQVMTALTDEAGDASSLMISTPSDDSSISLVSERADNDDDNNSILSSGREESEEALSLEQKALEAIVQQTIHDMVLSADQGAFEAAMSIELPDSLGSGDEEEDDEDGDDDIDATIHGSHQRQQQRLAAAAPAPVPMLVLTATTKNSNYQEANHFSSSDSAVQIEETINKHTPRERSPTSTTPTAPTSARDRCESSDNAANATVANLEREKQELLSALGAALIAKESALGASVSIKTELEKTISALELELDSYEEEKGKIAKEYQAQIVKYQQKLANLSNESEIKLLEREKIIDELKYSIESLVQEKETLVLQHKQQIETLHHDLEVAISERELIAVEYLQLMQAGQTSSAKH